MPFHRGDLAWDLTWDQTPQSARQRQAKRRQSALAVLVAGLLLVGLTALLQRKEIRGTVSVLGQRLEVSSASLQRPAPEAPADPVPTLDLPAEPATTTSLPSPTTTTAPPTPSTTVPTAMPVVAPPAPVLQATVPDPVSPVSIATNDPAPAIAAPDNAGPAIGPVTGSPLTVSIGGTLTLSAGLTDSAGVAGARFDLILDGAATPVAWCSAPAQLTSGAAQDGTWTVVCEVPADAEPGTYRLSVSAEDAFGNMSDGAGTAAFVIAVDPV